jgi:hypothetical protein
MPYTSYMSVGHFMLIYLYFNHHFISFSIASQLHSSPSKSRISPKITPTILRVLSIRMILILFTFHTSIIYWSEKG